jgi:hypothetical protein
METGSLRQSKQGNEESFRDDGDRRVVTAVCRADGQVHIQTVDSSVESLVALGGHASFQNDTLLGSALHTAPRRLRETRSFEGSGRYDGRISGAIGSFRRQWCFSEVAKVDERERSYIDVPPQVRCILLRSTAFAMPSLQCQDLRTRHCG